MVNAYFSATGYLLQKVPLANDDMLLTVLTNQYGKINVFVSKLQRSKKKKAELDYFRFLELELSRPKQSFKLRSVNAQNDFSNHFTSYEESEFAFEMLKTCSQFCAEEKTVPEIMTLLQTVWLMKDLPLPLVQVFFYTKLLWHNGFLPRFDAVREACNVDPVTLVFLENPTTNTLRLSNHERQILEFIRRNEASTLLETYEKFEAKSLANLLRFLQTVIKNH